MTTLGQARKVALALPEATEEPHHDRSETKDELAHSPHEGHNVG